MLYPFGFGLSYTTFDIEPVEFSWNGEQVCVRTKVTNMGKRSGKEVVQLYASAPQGTLGKAARVLCGFVKTKELKPGESELIDITCNKYDFSSYDDSGASGHRSAYVLEAGTYHFYVGNDVRTELRAGSFHIDTTIVVHQLTPAMSPVMPFDRMRVIEKEGGYVVGYEAAPLRSYDLWNRINKERPAGTTVTGDKGYQLKDVREHKVTMEEFVAQIPKEQLCVLLRGEGMCSQKVTPGTAGAFGGVSEELQKFGIPVACCADGPSGIRMDVGTLAFSIPNGTCFSCSFNEELSSEMFEMVGIELRKNKIDTILGPGMNLHRSPLNGRNFEYFSEDPLLTGKMASALLKGLHRHRVTGTLKHFIGNNQEYNRRYVDTIASERALRELYLKGFEIACKEGGAYCIMSTYGPVNGIWTASNYDLLTHILRKEWGYQGLVMTDWEAMGNEEGEEPSLQENAAMVRSQNDIYMVIANPADNSNNDNLLKSIDTKKLTLGEVQRAAANLLNVIMNMPVMERYLDCEESCYRELYNQANVFVSNIEGTEISIKEEGSIDTAMISTEAGARSKFILQVEYEERYQGEITLRAKGNSELAQIPVSIFKDNELVTTISFIGNDENWKTYYFDLGNAAEKKIVIEFFFRQAGLEIESCKIVRLREK